jgi:hypothetical protein
MGKMKDLAIEMKETFWDYANHMVTNCSNVHDFVSEVSEYRYLLPLVDDSEFTELMVDCWNDFWQEKGHA